MANLPETLLDSVPSNKAFGRPKVLFCQEQRCVCASIYIIFILT